MLHRTEPWRPSSPGARRNKRAIVAAALATGLALTGCASAAPDPSAAPEQTLRFGLSGEPQDVKVGADQGSTGYTLDALIHRGLMAYDADGALVPALAESFEEIDPATYSFTLREGLEFSDGTPLTSANVKNTLLFLADPENGARTLAAMRNITEVETPDDRTAIVHLSENNADFVAYLADSTAFIAPDDALSADAIATVGAGPFVIEQDDAGVQLVLARNDAYYDADSVTLDSIDLVFYPDGTARTNALVSGDVDLIDYVPWEQFSTLESTDGVTIDVQNGLLMDIEFNVTDGPFADPLVREAVAYAVNRDSVVDAAFFGNAKAIYGPPIPESSDYYTEESQELWEYDPEHAKELLAEAGYPDGFSTTILTTSQYVFHQDTALTVQADLAEIGIDAELDSPDWATRMEKATSGDFQMKINGWGGIVSEPAYLESYLGGPDLAKSFGWNDPEIMAALAAGRTGADVDSRKAAYSEAIDLMGTNVPFVPLVQRGQAFAYKDTVTGFSNLPGFLTFFAGYTLASTSISAG
ncbi:ABC transporter substrate-binding protein [Labedella populi]|nr:ABC transporter substrate-binding protein [Labedella populi]